MYRFHSIKLRLIGLTMMLIVIAVSLRALIILPFAQDLALDKAATEQLLTASYVAREIDRSIQARRKLIEELATSLPPALLQQPVALAQWLHDRQRINPLFDRGLLLLQPDGHHLLGEYPVISSRAQLDHANSDWFQAALQAEGAVIGRPQQSQLSGEPTLSMAIAVRDKQGRVITVLAGMARLNMPGFLDRLQSTQFGTNSDILLVSPKDQLFVSASDTTMVLQATPAPGVDLLHDKAMAGYRGTGTATNAKGVEELSAIVSVPGTEWFVVAHMPVSEIFDLIHTLANRIFWKATPTILLIMIAVQLLLLLLPRILRPLSDSAHLMREMADGKRELAPLPITRQDEVGNLVAGFNYLVLRLREKEMALKASEKRLEFMAHHDALTGLYTRSMLEDRARQAFARAKRGGARFALLFCDLDDFKPINDQFGHMVGDTVLRQVAVRLSAERRQTDTVARLGGDEFVILLTDIGDQEHMAIHVTKQLLGALSAPFDIGGRTVTLGASIGIALYCATSTSAVELMSQADMAMYQAKRAGKNRYHLYTPDGPELAYDASPAARAGAPATRACRALPCPAPIIDKN
jgi:diguanylate cyclase (GGDEF)-like protein